MCQVYLQMYCESLTFHTSEGVYRLLIDEEIIGLNFAGVWFLGQILFSHVICFKYHICNPNRQTLGFCSVEIKHDT